MAFTLSASINQAINFLTRPLSLVHSPATIHALQTILRSTFYAAFYASSTGPLILTFTTAAPPRPVFAACIAIGIQWAEWIEFFGQRDFDLIIDARRVVVRYHATQNGLAPHTVTLWSQPELNAGKRPLLARLSCNDVAPVPISKLGQQVATGAKASPATTTRKTRASPTTLPARIILPCAPLYPPVRTLAQQLLDSDDEEADELFAMISKTSIISPTPTRERFSFATTTTPTRQPFVRGISPISSPEPSSSSESSRPSSRSSTFSTASEEGSLSSSSSLPCVVVTFDEEEEAASSVYVDTSKKDKTKYLYQGGVSSTLTGGVMLGCPAAAKPTLKPWAAVAPAPASPRSPAQQQKYRAPVGGRCVPASGSLSPSWRRSAPSGPGPYRW